jgi:hypothetical protein
MPQPVASAIARFVHRSMSVGVSASVSVKKLPIESNQPARPYIA